MAIITTAAIAATVVAKLGPLAVMASTWRRRLGGKVPSAGTIGVVVVAGLVAAGVWVAQGYLGKSTRGAERTRTITETKTALEKAALAAENVVLRAAIATNAATLAQREHDVSQREEKLATFERQQQEIRDASTAGKPRTIVIPAGDPWLVRHRPFGEPRGVR